MDENPYASPQVASGAETPDLVARILRVTRYQSWLVIAGAAQVIFVLLASLDFPRFETSGVFIAPVLIVATASGAALIFLLSLEVYPAGWGLFLGIVLGLYALVPCLGLIATFYLYDQAGVFISANRVKQGLLGDDADAKEKQLEEMTKRAPPN